MSMMKLMALGNIKKILKRIMRKAILNKKAFCLILKTLVIFGIPVFTVCSNISLKRTKENIELKANWGKGIIGRFELVGLPMDLFLSSAIFARYQQIKFCFRNLAIAKQLLSIS